MICAVLGAIASLKNSESGLGKEFLEGLYSIGYIFIPVAGVMASIPFLSKFVSIVIAPFMNYLGADPSLATTSIIAVDMGGYQLAKATALTNEAWILSMIVGYMSGATIVFSIPVALSMIDKNDRDYLALGFMSGILAIPFGVFFSSLLIYFFKPTIRSIVSTSAVSDSPLNLTFNIIFSNLFPLLLFVSFIALGLRFYPRFMLKAFSVFGKFLETLVRLILVFSIVEYFTGFFTKVFGGWGFDPIIADSKDMFRALEIAGYIGIMLSGAFPMVYLIRKYLERPLSKVGETIGLGPVGTSGIVAAMANILAMFRLVKEMNPKEKVINISFAVCAAFLFGDHLAFTANFQPNLILIILLGKIAGGFTGIYFAYLFVLKKTETLSFSAA